MVVVTDKKIGVSTTSPTTDAEYYLADVLSSQDYYSFGALMPGRGFTSSTGHRYGANSGNEKDDEIYGAGNSYSAEYWQYDSRLGRRWNVDPIRKSWESPFASFANNPVYYVDPSGLDKGSATKREKANNGGTEGSGTTYSGDGNTRTNGNTTQTLDPGCDCYVNAPSPSSSPDDQGAGETVAKGGGTNVAQQIYGLGKDLATRESDYHNPYMNDLVSNNKTNAEIALTRQNNLAKVREGSSPLGKSLAENEKTFEKSINITEEIIKGERNLGLPNATVSGYMKYAPTLKLVGAAGVMVQVAISADNIMKSDYNQKVIVKEGGGLAGATLWGTMGATYGAALGPLGALAGGIVGGALGYWVGSGEVVEDTKEFIKQ
jgi:hypothetical protein